MNYLTTFGIEIETLNTTTEGRELSSRTVADALNSVGVECRNESYNHITRRHWKTIIDSSCGLETVSPVMDPRNGNEENCWHELTKVCQGLKIAGAKVNKNCGLHVHLCVRPEIIPFETLKKFCAMYIRMEHMIDLAMPKSRRKANNYYCVSQLASWNHDSNTPSYSGRRQHNYPTTPEHHLQAVNGMIKAIMACDSIDDLARLLNAGNDRFFKLNLQSYHAYGTLEIRHGAGTVSAEKMIMWVRFLMSLLNAAHEATRVKKLLQVDTSITVVWNMLWRMDDRQACTWFCNRIRKFAEIEHALVNDEDLINTVAA